MKHLKTFAALCCVAAAFAACEPQNGPDNGQNGNQNGDNGPASDAASLVITGNATDVAYNSVTLYGSLNTDSLGIIGHDPVWGIEWAYTKEAVLTHKYQEATRVKCMTELHGEHANEYAVAIDSLDGDCYVYYSAYVSVNNKYYYGEVDSVHLAVRITANSNQELWGTVTGVGDYEYGTTATLTAEPIRGCYFQQWDDGSTDNPRTIAVTADTTYTAIFDDLDYIVSGTEYGHDYVDLGLPSGLKWATCNVGATAPENYGNYYAWGETKTKAPTTYHWVSYKWCDYYCLLTKYCNNAYYGSDGFTDTRTMLTSTDDAAHTNWNGAWRMPTDAEWTELREQCEWIWTILNDVTGYRVHGPNGNSIFLPAAGCCRYDGLSDAGLSGYYWSSSLRTEDPRYAWDVRFGPNSVNRSIYGERDYGQSVRPVFK
ncbi:MAG: hypothetical protein ACI30H_00065 [Paludibacteraceae bacterium]